MDYAAFFIQDPNLCGGQLAVRGTRVTIRTILASLAEGANEDEILADFPTLTRDAARAVIAFAAASAEEDLPLPPAVLTQLFEATSAKRQFINPVELANHSALVA